MVKTLSQKEIDKYLSSIVSIKKEFDQAGGFRIEALSDALAWEANKQWKPESMNIVDTIQKGILNAIKSDIGNMKSSVFAFTNSLGNGKYAKTKKNADTIDTFQGEVLEFSRKIAESLKRINLLLEQMQIKNEGDLNLRRELYSDLVRYAKGLSTDSIRSEITRLEGMLSQETVTH